MTGTVGTFIPNGRARKASLQFIEACGITRGIPRLDWMCGSNGKKGTGQYDGRECDEDLHVVDFSCQQKKVIL